MSRSLKLNKDYQEKIKVALLRKRFPSQKALAIDLGIALSTVSRFFTGKTVDYLTFVEISEHLDLDWQEIVDLNSTNSSPETIKPANSTTTPQPEQNFVIETDPSSNDLTFPGGAIASGSPIYQSRDNVESTCYETVVKPASLIRIKAPTLMGKSSLIVKTLAFAQSQNYRTVYLDLANVEKSVITVLDKFLRWLCFMTGKQLGLANQLSDYWDLEVLGSNGNCTAYFEEYLLPNINSPVVLALDEVDRLFAYDTVVEDFLAMLRSWHEKGKIFPIWQKLRLIVSHSTEVYIPLDLNQSPFNAGVPIELSEFDANQLQNLASIYQLSWTETEISKIMDVFGGHPYLNQLAMYSISSEKTSLEQLLETSSKEAGSYNNHLRRQLDLLQQKPTLVESYKQVVNSNSPVALNPKEIYQLYSMGLVELNDNRVVPRCKLYRDYFSRVL